MVIYNFFRSYRYYAVFVIQEAYHATGHFLYAGTLFRQFLAISCAGTAFQHTGFSPKRKNVRSVEAYPTTLHHLQIS